MGNNLMALVDHGHRDLEILDRTLTQIEIGLPNSVDALISLDDLAATLRDCQIPAWQKGAYLLCHKKRSHHGEFKASLTTMGINYQYAAQLMRIAKAVAKYPIFRKIVHFTLLRYIAYQPEEICQRIADFFSTRDWNGDSADEIRALLIEQKLHE
jgi:hypothetical protein